MHGATEAYIIGILVLKLLIPFGPTDQIWNFWS